MEGMSNISRPCYFRDLRPIIERTLRLISIYGDKNSYQEYLATLCKIIIKLNKVTTMDVRDGSVGST